MTKEFSMRNVLRSGLISLFVALVAGGPLAYGGTAPSTTTLSSLLNPSTYGTYAMFQATVTNTFPCVGWGGRGVCPTPTGQVSFYNGGTLFATGTLSNGGTAVGTSALTVGSHSITATYGGDSNYASSTSNTVTQTVNKATPTITWSNPSAITYGTALGGTQLNASANVQGSFAYTPASGTVLGAGSGQTLSTTFTPNDTTDYNTASDNVLITVNPAGLTITASSGSMSYGGTPPTVTPSYSGFVNNDTSGSLSTQPTCATTATNSTSAGTDTGADTCSGAVDANYSISYVAGNVTVGQASLTISASYGSMTYGGTPPTVTPSYSGFVDGQSASSLSTQPTCSTTVTSSSPVGTYTGADTCSGAVDGNYTISYVSGNVTVGTASLTVTASGGSMTYDGTVPTITPSYSGFVNGDTSANLSTQPTCSTTATTSSPVGSYPSSCSGATDSNYTITYTNGSVTLSDASTSVSLQSNLNPSNYQNSVTFTATVSPSEATGTVTFYDFNGAITLGNPVALNSGVATLTISTLAPGAHSVTATYNGDSNDHPGTSAALGQTVNRLSMTLPPYCRY